MTSEAMTNEDRHTVQGHADRGFAEAGFGLVEVMVSVVILAFGLLAVAGLTMGVASQTTSASLGTDQVMAAQQVLEETIAAGYDAYPPGTDETVVVTVGDTDYEVRRIVTTYSEAAALLEVIVEAKGTVAADTFEAMLYDPVPPPTP